MVRTRRHMQFLCLLMLLAGISGSCSSKLDSVATAKQSVSRASEGPQQAKLEIRYLMDQYSKSDQGTWSDQRGIAVVCSNFPEEGVAKEYVELLLFYKDHREPESAGSLAEYKVRLKSGVALPVEAWLDAVAKPFLTEGYQVAWQRVRDKLVYSESAQRFEELD